ncbi:hypothetical protein Dsin_024046 [Dipteronia sinensis]|uniref:Calcium-transporting ATPase n=1 Tax=Dipteronia sinensis TaxID=43782 RepID=A0AAE0A620_9ROSI|nr:hypothetical protein Dsin_024046 [Dipteronia sinensis]
MSFQSKEPDHLSRSKRAQRRWRMAFRAIYFTRVLLSLKNKVLDKCNQLLLHSPSHVAVHIDDQNENPRNDCHDVDKKMISEMVKEKKSEYLCNLGGVKGVAEILESDPYRGVSDMEADLEQRRNVFGGNNYAKQPSKSLLSFVFAAFKDTTIITLLGCALLSLGFGINQQGIKNGWYDGGSIILAVFLVVIVSAVSNFKQNRQLERLSNVRSDIRVEVVRDGRSRHVSIFDIVVGDVVCLKIGDQVPADGLFLHGLSLIVDESSMTGESDHVEIKTNNPFLVSGTKVVDGYGHMLVTSVGMNTAWGEMMSSISSESNEQTPLQTRLKQLAFYIGTIGFTMALVVRGVKLVLYFTGITKDEMGNVEFLRKNMKFEHIMVLIVGKIIKTVTVLVVAIPRRLPQAFALTLAFSMKRMMKDHAMVRNLSACEKVALATIICTDKTCPLTLNQMKVTEFCLGTEAMEGADSLDLAPNVYELLQEAVGLNTIGSVYNEISGSPTEKAILSWAVIDLGMNVDEPKQNCEVLIHVEAFNSEKKRSGVLMRRRGEKAVQTHWKGSAEMIVAMCSHYYDRSGMINAMDDEERMKIGTIIKDMAEKSLRCIAFAYKQNDEQIPEKLEETGFALLGVAGLKDPCHPGVRTAVESCRNAGVKIKMITGDNVHTARAIAIECGILNPDEDLASEAVVEGVEFRDYSTEERMAKIENIRVMARSSPFDKLLMVQSLKQKGHVVAVTGDGNTDAPALKEADIGLSMGIQGTEVAKESSDIVILDDNFASVVTVLRWGRCVYNNIQKFIQFQLTVNVVALVINFVSAICSSEVPLTAVQLLWVNLIMDTLGALALATEPPTDEDHMKRPPVDRSQPLITKTMWRNLISQAIFQVSILLTLQFRGRSIFDVSENVKNTIIFNTFVFCQVFNEFNCRRLEKKNIFEGIRRDKLFIPIIGITIVIQIAMVEILNKFAHTVRLNSMQWAVSIAIASLSWLIGVLFKCIPVSGKHLSERDSAF